MECLLDNWNWSLGHRWDANFGVPLAFGSLVRGVCWCSAVPSFSSVSLSSRSVVPRLCFRDSPQVVYILYLVHGKFLTRFSNALGIFDTMIEIYFPSC